MESDSKSCACKGIRTCLMCEKVTQKKPDSEAISQPVEHLFYCASCEAAWTSPDHSDHHGDGLPFPGISLYPEFVSCEEELDLVQQIDCTPWVESQSGRKKQDYGPKVNFKKRKFRPGGFTGLPAFSRDLYERMKQLPCLQDFLPVELCNLDYHPERGSAIDPHFDDFWVWGERLVTLNLLSDTYLTFTNDDVPSVEVAVPLIRRSLIVVYGPARKEWKHSIKRGDIKERRLATTLRELTPEFLEGGPNESAGKNLLDVALSFSGVAVGVS